MGEVTWMGASEQYFRVHVLMRDEKEGRKKQARSNNKAKQHNTPKAVTFPSKNEQPRVGLMYMFLNER